MSHKPRKLWKKKDGANKARHGVALKGLRERYFKSENRIHKHFSGHFANQARCPELI